MLPKKTSSVSRVLSRRNQQQYWFVFRLANFYSLGTEIPESKLSNPKMSPKRNVEEVKATPSKQCDDMTLLCSEKNQAGVSGWSP